MTSSQKMPLAGVKILDMTRLLPGNFATLLLSGLGADVIKIEEPRGGDGTRHMFVADAHSESGAHLVLNRGKRSLAIDLKSDEGRRTMLRLVAHAPVLIDSFRPGVLDRLGLGRAELEAANPTLVHVSINAFGETGPYIGIPAHDLNSQGYAGVLSLVAGADGGPPMPAVQNADMAAGLHAALAVVAGLRAAERDGEFFRADVAMTDSAASLLSLAAGTLAATGSCPPVPDMLNGRLACYGVYECADEKWLTVGGLEAKFFTRMTELMGVPELAARQYDLGGQESLRSDLAAAFKRRPSADWITLLAHEDTCVGPVLTLDEALREPHFVKRGVVTEANFRDGPSTPVFKSIPWMTGGDQGLTAPHLGEQSVGVLAEAGLRAAEIAGLAEKGIVGPI
jgi:alpha-methylacyl-CoA racemase